MRKINLLVMLMLTSSPGFSQEMMKVDLDGPVTRTGPRVISGAGIGPGYPHRLSDWRVDLSASPASSSGTTMLEVHFVNVSAIPRTLPVAQDGAKVVDDCTDHTVFEGGVYLASKADEKYLLRLGFFYGCEAFPATLLQLKPGEWVTYVKQVPTAHLRREVRASIGFGHTRYRPGGNGQTAEGLEPRTYEYSPWVQVPEAPAAGK